MFVEGHPDCSFLRARHPQPVPLSVVCEESWQLEAYDPQPGGSGDKSELGAPVIETLDPPPEYVPTSFGRERVEILLAVESQKFEAAAKGAQQQGRLEQARALFKRERLLANKARRYADCRLYGYERVCSGNYSHKFYQRYLCEMRFCQDCAPVLYRNLFRRLVGPLLSFIKRQTPRKGYTLARINFTVRSTGEVPTPEQIKKFNSDIRKVLKAEAKAASVGEKDIFGALWVDEFGYEKRGRRADRKAGGLNLHAHGLYYGPYLDWERLRDRWQKASGSTGVWLTEVKGWRRNSGRGIKRALAHLLKYVGKIPAQTPERIAALEIAFLEVRRVHTMGKFYQLKPADKDLQDVGGSGSCPLCRSPLLVVDRKTFRLRRVEDWEAEGYQDIEQLRSRIGRESVLSAKGP